MTTNFIKTICVPKRSAGQKFAGKVSKNAAKSIKSVRKSARKVVRSIFE